MFHDCRHDPFVVPPAPASLDGAPQLADGQMSAWVPPRVGAYGNLSCRANLGPIPKVG